MSDNVTIVCPCCETRLVVDSSTGAILREDRVVNREHGSPDARHREEILEKKFQEARRKAAENPDAPVPRPFDGD